MTGEKNYSIIFLVISFTVIFFSNLRAQNLIVDVNADLVSRYVWRGLNINDQPNIQPSITLGYMGIQLGLWGSYGLTQLNTSSENYKVSQEIDTWLAYSLQLNEEFNIEVILTDYYYPAGGIKIGNFNNFNNPEGAGAHTAEAGLIISGPSVFPLSLSSYLNVYNDRGNNVYIQADYQFKINEVNLQVFAGTTLGSKTNPDYYGTDKFNLINLGIKASEQIKITEDFSLPVFCSYILNPQAEISFLVFGISI